jgi:double-stranded uracil-DNA glycosylase
LAAVLDILPDILAPGLRLVVCGSAAGARSAELGAYYAGPGNQFWGMLHRVGLTPRLLKPTEFRGVAAYGIGLTDMAKKSFGSDSSLHRGDSDPQGLRRKIEFHQPKILAFNGKRSGAAFLGGPVAYGYQPGRDIGVTRIYVAPSTSGAARGFWNEDLWRSVADAVLAPDQGSTADRMAARTDSGR